MVVPRPFEQLGSPLAHEAKDEFRSSDAFACKLDRDVLEMQAGGIDVGSVADTQLHV